MFMSNTQVEESKPGVKRDSQVQCKDCGERHVSVGEERYRGPGMVNACGKVKEGRRLSGTESWKVSVLWRCLERLQKTFSGAG